MGYDAVWHHKVRRLISPLIIGLLMRFWPENNRTDFLNNLCTLKSPYDVAHAQQGGGCRGSAGGGFRGALNL